MSQESALFVWGSPRNQEQVVMLRMCQIVRPRYKDSSSCFIVLPETLGNAKLTTTTTVIRHLLLERARFLVCVINGDLLHDRSFPSKA